MPKQPPKKSQTAKSSRKQADAVQMIKADHKQVKQLFERFGSTSGDERAQVAAQLFTELEIHTKLEEELFYPAIREKLNAAGSGATEDTDEDEELDATAETDDEETDEDEVEIESVDGMDLDADDVDEDDEELVTVAYEEHQIAKDLIEQLRAVDPSSSSFDELFSELEESVLEHIAGEEDAILPLAAKELDVRALGAQMQQRRDDLLSSMAA